MSGNRTQGLLPARPRRAKGVRKLNHWPLILAAGVFLIILGVIGYTYHERLVSEQVTVAATDSQGVTGAGDHAKDVVGTTDAAKKPAPPGAPPSDKHPEAGPQPQQQAPPQDLPEQERVKAWQAYYQKMASDRQAEEQAASNALTDNSAVDFSGGAAGPSVVIPGLPGAGGAAVPAAGADPSAQAEKRAFLGQGGDVLGLNEDLGGATHGPKSDTIMEGTPIAGVMVGGANSDMPGMIVGQVSQNICDSQTGNDLLIPIGTKVVGIYDNSVSNGQERMGVIWNRLIFPDTSSRQLGSMEGADQGGYAGFHDQVNTHFWSKLFSAVLISIGGAAIQLSQPQAPVAGYYSPTQTGTAAVTQQMSQLGQQYAQAGLAIPNTLEIRPGYAFQIMVNKDLNLAPYHGESCEEPGVERQAATPTGPIFQ